MANRFVILEHLPPEQGCTSKSRTTEKHFDFMLESDEGILITFEILKLPASSGTTINATQIADHQLKYLTYEGGVSDNRGSVTRVGHGVWRGELEDVFELRFDIQSRNFADQQWKMQFESSDYSLSADFDSAGFSAETGRFLSLKRLL